MKENQQLMTEFVKLIERYPEIYDQNLDSYRTRFSEIAWAKVASLVRSELNEECTVDELKIKWKGIRSSFNRYKGKISQRNTESSFGKKYYLYDHLRFLEPHIRTKGRVGSPQSEQEKSENTNSESCNYVNVDNIGGTDDYTNIEEWNQLEIKPDVANKFGKEHETESLELTAPSRSSEASYGERTRKRKNTHEDKESDDDNEDLQFFKSILPDIRNFTIREKRKLKMGILQLIDDLENERKGGEGSQ